MAKSKKGNKSPKALVKSTTIDFERVVKSTNEISMAYEAGLKAFGKYKNKIEVANTKLLQGSVELDAAVAKLYPQENRWDYLFCYDSEVYFVEVHSADTGEVSVVEKKLTWLKKWLLEKAPKIDKIKAKNGPCYFWIQSKGCHILPTSPQYRRIINAGLKPISKLVLPQ